MAKREKKSKEKKAKGPKPIQVPKKALEQIRTGQQRVNDAAVNVGNYIAGVRAVLDVPERWVFDPKAGAFVPPKKGEK